jgi:hypothetical protein
VKSRIWTLAVATALAAATAAATPAAARPQAAANTPVPSHFVGVNAGGPLLSGQVELAPQFDEMVSSGVETARVLFNWAKAQPYKRFRDVPAGQRGNYVNVGGVPTDFRTTDEIVGLAAQRGITLLPIVLYAPSWDQGKNPTGGARPPAQAAPYASYLTALIHRYGPRGSFWRTHHPRLAVRQWQIWNEPNLTVYWPQPFAKSYVSLLRAAHTAIKRADRGATVVLGAITNVAWRSLGQIYAIRGARGLFDEVAVNGFTSTPRNVIRFLHLVRRAMNRLGDRRKPLLDTEISWPSSLGKALEHFDWDTTEAGQARDVAAVMPLLARNRNALRLRAFYYYTWMGEEPASSFNDFTYAGLLAYQSDGAIVPKPALAAYKRAALKIERCRRKGRFATRCIH